MVVLGCTAGLFRLKVPRPNESVASHALVTLHAYAGGRGRVQGAERQSVASRLKTSHVGAA